MRRFATVSFVDGELVSHGDGVPPPLPPPPPWGGDGYQIPPGTQRLTRREVRDRIVEHGMEMTGCELLVDLDRAHASDDVMYVALIIFNLSTGNVVLATAPRKRLGHITVCRVDIAGVPPERRQRCMDRLDEDLSKKWPSVLQTHLVEASWLEVASWAADSEDVIEISVHSKLHTWICQMKSDIEKQVGENHIRPHRGSAHLRLESDECYVLRGA